MSGNMFDLMNQAFDEKPVQKETPVQKAVAEPPAKRELAQAPETVNPKPRPSSPRPEAPPPQPKVRREYQAPPEPEDLEYMPTPVKQIARHDVPADHYTVGNVQKNFGCYDEAMDEWLSRFSKKNRRRGGCAITQSQLIHICLDVILYDLDIQPIGYKSHQDLREDIQLKLREDIQDRIFGE